ncbi:MAG: nuclear transport factor 2 family protein [Chloroflexi bacterium]|nr:nuclear transport factor 2 family protein [Chloroflexota bacterium]
MPAQRASAQSPDQLDPIFQQAVQSGDLEAIMALYEPGAVFPNQSGEVRAGLDAIRQEMEPFAASKPDITLQVEKVIQAGDIALIHTRWNMNSPMPLSGRAVEVARRQPDGTWRFLIDDPFTVGS